MASRDVDDWELKKQVAERGEIPSPPYFGAKAYENDRPKLEQVIELAKRGDVVGLKSFEIKTYNTGRRKIDTYRKLCIAALEARASNNTAANEQNSDELGHETAEGGTLGEILAQELARLLAELAQDIAKAGVDAAWHKFEAALPIIRERAAVAVSAAGDRSRTVAKHISGAADSITDGLRSVFGRNRPAPRKIDDRAEPSAEGCVLQIKRIGNSTGLILPKELLARLKLAEGDKLHVVEQTERGIKLSPYDPKHVRAMAIARRSFRKYADTYRALAK